jgi:hypothetical protein
MKLLKTDHGPIFCFGFDMVKRVENSKMICWNDPSTGEWEIKPENIAGCFFNIDVSDVEFAREMPDGTIIAYAPGRCLEIKLIGKPYLYSLTVLRPDEAASALVISDPEEIARMRLGSDASMVRSLLPKSVSPSIWWRECWLGLYLSAQIIGDKKTEVMAWKKSLEFQ